MVLVSAFKCVSDIVVISLGLFLRNETVTECENQSIYYSLQADRQGGQVNLPQLC